MSWIGAIFATLVMFVTFGGSNYYVARRIYQGINHVFSNVNPAIYAGVVVVIILIMIAGFMRSMLPISEGLKSILGLLGSYIMGASIYFLIYFLIADLILLIGSVTKIIFSPITSNVRFIVAITVTVLTLITVVLGVYNSKKIKHVSYNINIDKVTNLKNDFNLIMISDVHLGALGSEERIEDIVNEINKKEADLVCIAGDIFDNNYYAIKNPDKAIETLKNIKSTNGVYACPGNHDSGKTLNEMKSFLEKSNIKLLEDEHVVIDDKIVLVGRLDSTPIGGYGDTKRSDWKNVMEKINFELPIAVMDHNPANIREYDEKVDLILSGHTHKGQIFPGSLFTNLMFDVDYGYYRKDENSPQVIVSSGVGTWGMPMRVGTSCEIVSVNIYQ